MQRILFSFFVLLSASLSAQVDSTASDTTHIIMEMDTTAAADVDTTTSDSAVCIMSGIFTVGEENTIPEDGRITVTDAETDDLIGLYTPNVNTGKYLFILPVGKTYKVAFEVEGYVMKTETLTVPESTSFQKIYRKINLGRM